MIILVPFFGDKARFRPVLDAWISAYEASGTRAPWFALDDQPESHATPTARVDVSGFADLVRPGQPFDVKGVLICAALLKFPESILVLDADAVLTREPEPLLDSVAMGRPICMPVDDGALTHGRAGRLLGPWSFVQKMCAGVMFFPKGPGRSRLVAAYRKAWTELRSELPWDGRTPHLLEQHAWSVALHRRGGAVLPRAFNWHPEFLGENTAAVVLHRYGRGKWSA